MLVVPVEASPAVPDDVLHTVKKSTREDPDPYDGDTDLYDIDMNSGSTGDDAALMHR